MVRSHRGLKEEQVLTYLGLRQKSFGKDKARQLFLSLVDELASQSKAVEITDHERPVAVLLSYSHWKLMLAKLAQVTKTSALPPIQLKGSVRIKGNLDIGSS